MKQTNIFLKATLVAVFAMLMLLLAVVPISRTDAFAWDGTVATGFTGGAGTEQDPYLITTEGELAFLATEVNAGSPYTGQYFRLENNLSLLGFNWTPIGKIKLDAKDYPIEMIPFSGTFDGKGKTIDGLTFSDKYGQGLFGYIGKEGSVADLTLTNVTGKAQNMAGGVAGFNTGTIENVIVNNITLTGISPELGADNFGGIAGNNSGTVTTCTVQGTSTSITGVTSVGGIAGNNQMFSGTGSALITACEFKDGRLQTHANAGGIVAENMGRVEKSKIGSDIVIEAVNFGGIAGTNGETATIDLCAMNFKVTFSTPALIKNEQTREDVSVFSLFGGIAARNSGELSNCYFRGTWNGAGTTVGGIAAENTGKIVASYTLTGLLHSTDINGVVGGIAGRNSGTIDQTTAVFQKILGEGQNASLGGIAGINDGVISNAFAKGRVISTQSVAGGIAGRGVNGSVSNTLAVTNVSGLTTDGIFASDSGAQQSFYAEFAYRNLAGTSSGSRLSITELLSLGQSSLGSAWHFEEGKLPVINTFQSFSGESIAGISDRIVSDVQEWRTAGLSVLFLDNEEHGALQGVDFCLPMPPSKIGFSFSAWGTGQEQYSAGNCVSADGTQYSSVWVLDNIVTGTQSGDINKVYDGKQALLTVDFSHVLPLTYEWYYSNNNVDFSRITGSTGEYNVTNVVDSGYYYCEASVSSDGQTKSATSDVFEVVIGKAVHSGMNHAKADGGVYAPDKTLADIALFPGYRWTDGSVVPTAGTKFYSAIYNSDPANYHDFALTVEVVLSKAVYVDITHDDIMGTYDPRKPLSSYLLNSHFRWVDADKIPNVGTKSYGAVYNADENNYEDFSLNIGLDLRKANYVDVTHAGFIGTYSPTVTLADYKLNAGFVWEDKTLTPTVDITAYSAIYHLDPDNYNPYSLTIRVMIEQSAPKVTPVLDSVTPLYEGGRLPAISLGVGNTDGVIDWEEDVLILGTRSYTWSFQPSDSVNYKSASGERTLTALAVRITSVRKEGEGAKTDYIAFDSFNVTGINLIATYNNGEEKAIQHTRIQYENGTSFRYGDQTVDLICMDGEDEFCVSVNVTVEKRTVIKPSCDVTFIYTGEVITLPILPHDDYIITGIEQREVGEYHATVTLNDAHNHRWDGGDSNPLVIEWAIGKRVVSKPSLSKKYTYNGEEQQAEIVPTEDYDVVNYIQKNAGDYTLRVTLRDAAHTTWADATGAEFTLIWTINALYIGNPQAIQKTYVYDGQIQVFAYVTSKYMVVSGDSQTDAGRYKVVFRLADKQNTAWSVPGTEERFLYWDIAPLPVSKPVNEGYEFVYNGGSHTFAVASNDYYTFSGNVATDAGLYTARADLNGKNYCWEGGETQQLLYPWKIKKLEISLPIDGKTVVYNGLDIASSVVINKTYCEFVSGGIGRNAGNYDAVVRLTDSDNVCWIGGDVTEKTVGWAIAKREIEVPAPTTTIFVYNGRPIVLFQDIPSYITVSYGSFTETGIYTAEIRLTDQNNYAWTGGTTDNVPIRWEISAMKIAPPTANGTREYMGNEQTAPIAESAHYRLTGNRGTNANGYTATAILIDLKNTTWTSGSVSNIQIPWTIEQAKVELPILLTNGIYSGREQSANIAISSVCTVSENRGTTAGKYTATVRLNDQKNYIWTDGTSADKSVVWHIYSLQLNTDGGEDDVAYEPGTPLPTPTKEGYVFGGWYADENFTGTKIDKLTSLDGNAVLYAKWEKETDFVPVEPPKKTGGLSLYAIIGIAVGGVCALAAVAIIIYSSMTKSRRRRQD